MKTVEGKVVAEGLKIGIVGARFNEFIVSKLISGARDGLVRHGVNDDDITLARGRRGMQYLRELPGFQ